MIDYYSQFKNIKHLLIHLSFFIICSCNKHAEKEVDRTNVSVKKDTIAKTETELVTHKHDTIKTKQASPINLYNTYLQTLTTGCLEADSLYEIIKSNLPYDDTIDRNEFAWLYESFTTDSIQFEMAYYLKPLCRVFSNEKIDVIAFTDTYDYKQAIHLFTFSKKDYTPTSSFTLFSLGGDAEDFWNTKVIQADSLSFQLINEVGHVNDIETRDTTYIKTREIVLTSINPENGYLTKETLNTQKDLIEIK
ncbi:MAG: hypothetical protein CMO01_18685 [Thalassobius sp.]|nr:hypothetical protein [Thalassovita sp.]